MIMKQTEVLIFPHSWSPNKIHKQTLTV